MPRVLEIARIAVFACAAACLPAQDPSLELATIAGEEKAARLRFEHDAIAARWRALAERAPDGEVATAARARLAEVRLEAELLRRLAPLEELRDKPVANTLGRLQQLPLRAQDWLLLAKFAALADARTVAESALAEARDRDGNLKNATDTALAELRREPVPAGGYHRYRGEWLPLDTRDRARALDDALAALAAVAGPAELKLPLQVATATSNHAAFAALGDRGPQALRAAADALRAAAARRYDAVRGWCASYANPRARAALLDLDQRSREKAQATLELVRIYDKPKQHEVDALRAEIVALAVQLDGARTQDRRGYTTTPPAEAVRLRTEIEDMEEALRALGVWLAQAGQPPLPPVEVAPPSGAATTPARVLPGRTHSGLEDVLWLLLNARTGSVCETITRADELLRQRDRLTAWERLLAEDVRDEAIATFAREIAVTSLDAAERAFLDVLNDYRRALRLRCLEPDERLVRSSRRHSEEMVRLGYFGHVSPIAERRTPTLRARIEGFAGGVGENCLAGSADGAGAFDAWYRSPGHHRNMVGEGPLLGVGATLDHGMWTMVIGGGDASWRAAHPDVPPARRTELATQALQHAAELRKPRRGKDAPRPPTGDDPGLLPELLRLALPPCYESNQNELRTAGDLLRACVERSALPEQRPLIDVAVRTAKERLDLELGTRLQQPAAAVAPQPELTVPGRGDGPSLRAPLKLVTKSERQRLARSFGGGPRTERWVERGLAFLARCQDVDGAWRAQSFADLVPGLAAHKSPGRGNAEWELAMTGLALLCYTTTGSSSQQGEYAPQVDRGTRFLMSKLLDFGRFDTGASHYMYSHALATQALCEVYAYTADPIVGTYAQLAVDYLVAAQHRPSGGWRYEPDQSGDTSVVGWVVMALNSAHKAQLEVGGFRDALRFLDSVTEKQYYRVGYTSPADNHIFGNRLAAVAVTSRRFMGVQPGDPRLQWPAIRMREDLPDASRPDYYYWYYGTLAMFQVGGDAWTLWSDALVAALQAMHVERQGHPTDGSFEPDRHYSSTGGRLYDTTLAILCATAWYRYDRAPKPKLSPFTGDLDAAVAPYLAVFQAPPDERTLRLTEAKFADHLGPYAVGPLLRALASSRDKDVARRLARLVEQVIEPMNEGVLLQNLGASDDGEVREILLRALERICSPKSTRALTDAMANDARPQVRGLAARTLGALGAAETVPALAARLAVETDGWAKEQIQNALRRIASQGALDRLVNEAAGSSAGRAAVRSALQILERDQLADRIAELREAQPKLYKRITELVAKERDLATLPVLIALLEADAQPVRASAVGLLTALTQQTFGFDAALDGAARAESVQRWWQFWDEQQHRFGGKSRKGRK